MSTPLEKSAKRGFTFSEQLSLVYRELKRGKYKLEVNAVKCFGEVEPKIKKQIHINYKYKKHNLIL